MKCFTTTKLEELNLFGNDLSHIEVGTFDGLVSLKYLLLFYNNLTTLSQKLLKDIPRPFTMSISGEWDCKSICWLKEEIKHSSIVMEHKDLFECKNKQKFDEYLCPGKLYFNFTC